MLVLEHHHLGFYYCLFIDREDIIGFAVALFNSFIALSTGCGSGQDLGEDVVIGTTQRFGSLEWGY